MEEAAGPSRPTGRNALALRLESAKVGDPFSCSSGRRGLRAKHGAPARAAPERRGHPLSRIPRAEQG
eukprot:13288585-Alexandrium_andersonii.AAC.1